MSRRHAAEKRIINPDVKYNSVILSKFINNIMKDGKKATAEKIVYGALDLIRSKNNLEPLQAFNDCINNLKPREELKSVRVGGANYQVPSAVREERAVTLAIRWLIDAARKRKDGRSMMQKLSAEMFEAINSRGSAFKKKEDVSKMAEANKAFSHFAVGNNGGR
jgi:small subunit ribosomal protein S7